MNANDIQNSYMGDSSLKSCAQDELWFKKSDFS